MHLAMTLGLLALAAGLLGYVVGKRWLIFTPLVVGGVAAAAVAALGGSLSDTPIAFAVALATVGAALGLLLRGQQASLFRP
jgi:hypothetical protein